MLLPPWSYDLSDAGKGPSNGWGFLTTFNTEEAVTTLEINASQHGRDYIVVAEAQEFQADRFVKRVLFREGNSTALLLNFNPGQEVPSHTHPGQELFILVLEGSGTVMVDGRKEAVSKHDCLYLRGTESFSFKNTGEHQASLYIIMCKNPDEH